MKKRNSLRAGYAERFDLAREVRTTVSPSQRRARVILSVFVLLVFVVSALWAQTVGKISGVVKDQQTGEPLVGVNVLVVGTKSGATTDVDGAFFILNIPAGKYDVQASMVGYARVVQRGTIVNTQRTTNVDFVLAETTIEKEAIVIQATRPDVERDKTSTSSIIRADDVQSIAGMRDVDDVIALAADVTDGHFRGGRANEEYYTLQGMGIVNP